MNESIAGCWVHLMARDWMDEAQLVTPSRRATAAPGDRYNRIIHQSSIHGEVFCNSSPPKPRSNKNGPQQQQFENHDDGLDDIEDFEDSPPRQKKGQLAFPRSQGPPRLSAVVNRVSTPVQPPHQPKPSTSTGNSGKRKSFYDEIDPDLLALASGKKSKRDSILANSTRSLSSSQHQNAVRFDPRSSSAASIRPTNPSRTPRPVLGSNPTGKDTTNKFSTLAAASAYETPTPKPQSQFRKPSLPSTLTERPKGRGFEIDPDLLATASPVKTRTQRGNRKQPSSQSFVAGDLSSSAPATEHVPQATNSTSKPNQVPGDEINPESPQSSAPLPVSTPTPTLQQQKRPVPISPSLNSIADSIEDHESSPVKPKQQKRQRPNDIEEIDVDAGSESSLSPHQKQFIPQSVKPKHMDDASTSGDSITDPDFMEIDDDMPQTPPSQTPMYKRMLKRFNKSKPATQPDSTPRPGYVKLLELHKTIVLPKPPPRPPGTPPTRQWFVDNGLADTVTDWKETIHGTRRVLFQDDRKRSPPAKDFRITVDEFLRDGKMVIIKGLGVNGTESEGILKAMISGTAAQEINDIGCVVRYAKPWFPIRLFGEEEPYRCLIGPLDVVNFVDADVQMAG